MADSHTDVNPAHFCVVMMLLVMMVFKAQMG